MKIIIIFILIISLSVTIVSAEYRYQAEVDRIFANLESALGFMDELYRVRQRSYPHRWPTDEDLNIELKDFINTILQCINCVYS